MTLGGRDTHTPRRLSRYSLAGVLVAAALVGLVVLLAGGGGTARRAAPAAARTSAPAPASRGAAVRAPGASTAGAPAPAGGGRQRLRGQGRNARSGATRAAAVTGAPGTIAVRAVREVPDPEAARSFPAPATIHHAAATAPAAAASAAVAAGAPSDAEVRRELKQMTAVQQAAQQPVSPVSGGGGSIGGTGTWTPPPGVPAVVARVIAGGNAIADFPYRIRRRTRIVRRQCLRLLGLGQLCAGRRGNDLGPR